MIATPPVPLSLAMLFPQRILCVPQAISRGITKAGVAVDMLNLETENLDTVAKAISSGNGFIIGELGGHLKCRCHWTRSLEQHGASS